jgi:hypothetical protein
MDAPDWTKPILATGRQLSLSKWIVAVAGRLRSVLGVAAGCLLIQAAHPIAQQPRSAPVFVGVLRADGVFVPIAIHDGHEWWNRWPFSYESDESVRRLSVPASIENIPDDWLPPGVRLPTTWHLQLTAGGNRSIRLGTPVRPTEPWLAALIGLSTSYRVPTSLKGTTMSDAEAGVAVTGDATLGRFSPASDTESRAMFVAITDDLHRAEAEEIAFRRKETGAQLWDGRPVPLSVNPRGRPKIAKLSYGALRAHR